MGFIRDFKEFISRGNVIDLAVGVIIGGAFGSITTSLVNDVVMPPIGLLLAGIDFSKLKYILKDAYTDAAGKEHVAVAINYGAFIQTLVNFLIISLVIFIVIRLINDMRRKQEAKGEAAEPETPTPQEALLTDIRDILKKIDEKR
jgi:large conductance mechanosensitive channel